MTHRQHVDKSPSSCLAVCSCGWRQLTGSTPTAWAAAHTHALHAHPGDDDGTSRRRAGAYK